jgi:hypothetical protein
MRTTTVILQVFFLLSLLTYTGCEPAKVDTKPSTHVNKASYAQDYSGYTPAKVDIMPLTEFVLASPARGSSGGERARPEPVERVESAKLRIYVSLLDSFDCQMKSPGVFRFELYERVLLSAEPKGKRIILWPDIDLTDAVKNNRYWKNFLRAYEFNLDFEPKAQQDYILQATFLSPAGRRLSDEFNLKSPK